MAPAEVCTKGRTNGIRKRSPYRAPCRSFNVLGFPAGGQRPWAQVEIETLVANVVLSTSRRFILKPRSIGVIPTGLLELSSMLQILGSAQKRNGGISRRALLQTGALGLCGLAGSNAVRQAAGAEGSSDSLPGYGRAKRVLVLSSMVPGVSWRPSIRSPRLLKRFAVSSAQSIRACRASASASICRSRRECSISALWFGR